MHPPCWCHWSQGACIVRSTVACEAQQRPSSVSSRTHHAASLTAPSLHAAVVQALDVTTLTIMRILPREVDPVVFNMTQAGAAERVCMGCCCDAGDGGELIISRDHAPPSCRAARRHLAVINAPALLTRHAEVHRGCRRTPARWTTLALAACRSRSGAHCCSAPGVAVCSCGSWWLLEGCCRPPPAQ